MCFAIFVSYKSYKLMQDKATSLELIALLILLCTFLLQTNSALQRTPGFPLDINYSLLLFTDRLSEIFALIGLLSLMLITLFVAGEYLQ